MPINTYVELDKATLLSNGGPITFTNIPQTYTDLRIVLTGGFVDSGFMIGARVGNGSIDSGANYSYSILRGNGSSPTSYQKSNMVFGAFCQQGGNNLSNVITVDFLNYSNTTTHKTWISRYGNAGEGTDAGISLWRSTSAITTISIAECGDGGSGSFNYGNMLSGTTVSLYGIKAWANTEASPKATGGYVYSDSSYWYHAFPFSSTFTPNQSLTADALIIAGGGAGAHSAGGGGGAGGISYNTGISLTATGYPVTVGAGGSIALTYPSTTAQDGNNSSFSSYTAYKGGAGGGYTGYVGGGSGTFGSGGGGGGSGTSGGAGTSGQGFAGGNGNAVGGGGGGGAGGAGSNAPGGNQGGAGGIGTNAYATWLNITGYGVDGYIAGGGGGGGFTSATSNALGGLGGGGNGSYSSDPGAEVNGVARAGRSGTGSGGGGGGGSDNGSSGGSGLVIIRYAK